MQDTTALDYQAPARLWLVGPYADAEFVINDQFEYLQVTHWTID